MKFTDLERRVRQQLDVETYTSWGRDDVLALVLLLDEARQQAKQYRELHAKIFEIHRGLLEQLNV